MLNNMYASLPIFIQNSFISVYGFKLYHQRYMGQWKKYFDYLLNNQFISKNKIEQLQKDKLIHLLKYAVHNIPYYRMTFKVSVEEFSNHNIQFILSNIPILEKSMLREQANQFISEKYNKNRLIKLSTSGTTGTPLDIYISYDARRRNYAFFERAKYWAGLKRFERSATFAGRAVVPAMQINPPFWRKNIIFKNTLFSSYHLSEKNIPLYINALKRINPKFIDSYPSSLEKIAQYCLDKNISTIRPKAIVTSAETLLEHQREIIESAFNCKIFDQYGSTEQVVFANQCEYGSYHVNPEFGILEVVDKKGKAVMGGELGEFVCTGFTNYAMPLIRYKIGDMGILSNNKCRCGRHFPVIEKIYGRDDDILTTPDGRYIGRLDPIFKGLESTIKETQIIQQKLDLIEIFIVKTDKYKEEDGLYIKKELEKRIGQGVNYRIIYKDFIQKTKNGKFRAVINNVA